jgi:FKBP-type peptidyl-prolyl cis-trans isomerase FkpA
MNRFKEYLTSVLSLIIGLLIFTSCEKDDPRIEEEKINLQKYLEDNDYTSIEPASNGLYHVVIEEGDGISPVRTDFVNITFTATLLDGTVFETSDRALAVARNILRTDKLYGPSKFLLNNLGITGLREGIMMMKQGGESKLIIPSNLAYGSIDYGIIPPYSTVIYQIKLHDVINDPDEHEQKLLELYLAANEITVEPTNTGLYYIELEPGSGDFPESDSEIAIHYKGTLLDGRVFDQSTGTPATFYMDSPFIIPGVVEGVGKMKKGGKARFIIPWDLAYGPQGSADGLIPPYTTLVFDVELSGIKF